MPTLPSHSHTYYFRANLSCTEAGGAVDHRRRLLFEIMRTLIGTGTGWTNADGSSVSAPTTGWAVVSSSDSVAADATNRIEAIADLVWAADGVAHSWFQLRHQHFFGTNVPLYILFDCTQGGAHLGATLGLYMSRNEFMEGGILTRPTATNEVEILPTDGSMTTAPWQGPATNDEDHRVGRLHGIISDDGRVFKAVICRGGIEVGYFDLFRDFNYEVDEWSLPACFAVISRNADATALEVDEVAGAAWFHSRDDVSVMDEFGLAPMISSDGATLVVALAANSGTGDSGWDAVKLASRAPAANALRTAVPDVWWGRTAESDAVFGDDGRWVQFTNFVVPWMGDPVEKS